MNLMEMIHENNLILKYNIVAAKTDPIDNLTRLE
jgi:hypothetical protein